MSRSAPRVPPESSEPSAARRLNLNDAMILTAGFALFLGLGRELFYRVGNLPARWWRSLVNWLFTRTYIMPRGMMKGPRGGTSQELFETLVYDSADLLRSLGRLLLHFLLAATPALLVIRLRKPRPPLDVVMRQPGATVQLVATVGFTCGFAFLRYIYWYWPFSSLLSFVGATVAATFILFEVFGPRLPERGWLECSGRLVGAGWIALGLCSGALRPW